MATWSFYDPLAFQLLAGLSLVIMILGPLMSVWFFWGTWSWASTKKLDEGWDYDPNNAGELLVKPRDEHKEKTRFKLDVTKLAQLVRRRLNPATRRDEENQGASMEMQDPKRPPMFERLTSLLFTFRGTVSHDTGREEK